MRNQSDQSDRTDQKNKIKEALHAFSGTGFRAAAIGLLNSLGYRSEKTLDMDNTPAAFLEAFDRRERKLRKDKALFDRWKSVDFLFQITDYEVRGAGSQSTFDFASGYDAGNYRSYLFLALDLEKDHYTRTQLSTITREINLLFDMPAMLLIRYNGMLTFSIIDRRLSKQNENRDVLEKVRLIKDIRCEDPHRAHVEILYDLSLPALIAKHECRDFRQLHEAWRKTLDIEVLNRNFYRRIQEWFFWAAGMVRFPHGGIDDEELRNRTALIRLLTRLVFCWFAREKGLIPDRLFAEDTAREFLKDFDPLSADDGSYYLAVLQNLFFPTLSVPVNKRKFRDERRFAKGANKHYMRHDYFRHQSLFRSPKAIRKLFAEIPFLNGGLFECLDTGTCKNDEIRVDGFSDVGAKQPFVPNLLFFGRDVEADLGRAYGSDGPKMVRVNGLFPILNAYKFTVAENTPVEEEIALDPELLGRIFENLLAEYNPETEKSARNETGSFYTPRTIVDYMVDSALKAYLKQSLTEKLGLSGGDADTGLDILFAYTEKDHPFTEKEKQVLVDAIYEVSILDPACGSGAFPLGMLQKLVYVLEKLDHGHEHWKRRILKDTPAEVRDEMRKGLERGSIDYKWKLGLIRHSIYGIDIQPIAVQIAKLRCFVALLVDFRVDPGAENLGVPALPNLDFKFVAADALVRPPAADREGMLPGMEDSFYGEFAAEAREYFFVRDPAEKLRLRKRIERLIENRIAENERSLANRRGDDLADAKARQAYRKKHAAAAGQLEYEISLWESYRNIFAFRNAPVRFFDVRYFFPELRDGFNVLIGNPPYIQIQKLPKARKQELRYQGYRTYTAMGDIYCLFYERGAELLRPGGHLCYISSNKWMRAEYGEALRSWLAKDVNTQSVFDFGMAQNFGSATTYTCVACLSKDAPDGDVQVCYAADDRAAMTDPEAYFRSNTIRRKNLSKDSWIVLSPGRQRVKDFVQAQGTPLEQWKLNINYGIKTGLNEAFYIDSARREEILSREPHAEGIIVPLLRGRFVERYGHSWDGTWMIFTRRGIDIDRYPVIREHLGQYFSRLRPRNQGERTGRKPGAYEWYEIQDTVAYHEDFRKPKIIYQDIAIDMPFYFDRNERFFFNNTCWMMVGDSEDLAYLTAIFNSTCFRCCFRHNFPEYSGNASRLFSVFFEKNPDQEA